MGNFFHFQPTWKVIRVTQTMNIRVNLSSDILTLNAIQTTSEVLIRHHRARAFVPRALGCSWGLNALMFYSLQIVI